MKETPNFHFVNAENKNGRESNQIERNTNYKK
jgi:hypothetical protein